MISVHLQGKTFSITIIQVYAPTSNAEEGEVERFYEDLQDLLELTPKKDVLYIIGDRNDMLYRSCSKILHQQNEGGETKQIVTPALGDRYMILPTLCVGNVSHSLKTMSDW